ncbi:hypothetical protein GGX14DRAFT_620652 [Mycena pura]|uniref:Uncharacterized protein n=1 Tax=Mycena pura TaxID=153505 RepID=A0AAD6YBV2_9AGAR|nr:hypothetical protein GGX14DRAFT_620652 [Mycena pura]
MAGDIQVAWGKIIGCETTECRSSGTFRYQLLYMERGNAYVGSNPLAQSLPRDTIARLNSQRPIRDYTNPITAPIPDIEPIFLTHHYLTGILWHVAGNGVPSGAQAILPTDNVLLGHALRVRPSAAGETVWETEISDLSRFSSYVISPPSGASQEVGVPRLRRYTASEAARVAHSPSPCFSPRLGSIAGSRGPASARRYSATVRRHGRFPAPIARNPPYAPLSSKTSVCRHRRKKTQYRQSRRHRTPPALCSLHDQVTCWPPPAAREIAAAKQCDVVDPELSVRLEVYEVAGLLYHCCPRRRHHLFRISNPIRAHIPGFTIKVHNVLGLSHLRRRGHLLFYHGAVDYDLLLRSTAWKNLGTAVVVAARRLPPVARRLPPRLVTPPAARTHHTTPRAAPALHMTRAAPARPRCTRITKEPPPAACQTRLNSAARRPRHAVAAPLIVRARGLASSPGVRDRRIVEVRFRWGVKEEGKGGRTVLAVSASRRRVASIMRRGITAPYLSRPSSPTFSAGLICALTTRWPGLAIAHPRLFLVSDSGLEYDGSRPPAFSARCYEGEAAKDEEGPYFAVQSPAALRAAIVARDLGLGVPFAFRIPCPTPCSFDVIFDPDALSSARASCYLLAAHPPLSPPTRACPPPVAVTLAASTSSAAQQAPAPVLAFSGHSNSGAGGCTYRSTAVRRTRRLFVPNFDFRSPVRPERRPRCVRVRDGGGGPSWKGIRRFREDASYQTLPQPGGPAVHAAPARRARHPVIFAQAVPASHMMCCPPPLHTPQPLQRVHVVHTCANVLAIVLAGAAQPFRLLATMTRTVADVGSNPTPSCYASSARLRCRGAYRETTWRHGSFLRTRCSTQVARGGARVSADAQAREGREKRCHFTAHQPAAHQRIARYPLVHPSTSG